MWRKGKSCTQFVGMSTGAATVEKSTEVSQKVRNRTTLGPQTSTPGYVTEKNPKILI